MTIDAERCPKCRQSLLPGAVYCTHCGTPLSNRAARSERNLDKAQLAAGGPVTGPRVQGLGSIGLSPQVSGQRAAEQQSSEPWKGVRSGQHVQGGGTTMATKLELVPASTGKRLGAAVLDWLAPAVALVTAFLVGAAGITETRSGGYIVYDTGLLVVLTGIASGATLAYGAVLMIVEARTGNTIGNQVMGIRSADAEGYAPGGGAVFLRGLVTGAGILLALLVTVLVVVFGWFAVAGLVVLPLFVLGTAWAVIVVVSVAWDRGGKLRGWHDKAAKTLAFDIAAGRNPVATGGIQGPYSFAPVDLPPVQHVPSPVPGALASTSQVINAQAAPAPAVAAPPEPVHADGHPDDDLERTRMRSERRVPQAVLRIRIDDGQDVELAGTALLGRNPASQVGESVEQLVPVADPGRSISKTHLHLRREADGVWITDRNSTNGSAVTTPDGVQTRLHPGHPIFVRPGSAVHFGDRTFHVGQA